MNEPPAKKPRTNQSLLNVINERAKEIFSRGFEFQDILRNELGEMSICRLIDDRELEHLEDLCWEKLHSGSWSAVHDVWRELNAWIAIGKLSLGDLNENGFREIFKTLDLAIIMGGEHYVTLIHDLMSELENVLNDIDEWKSFRTLWKTRISEAQKLGLPNGELKCSGIAIPVYKVSQLSLIKFLELMKHQEFPVIIEGLIEDWPAFNGSQNWRDLSNLTELAGHRYVPVEIGSHYVSEEWTQKLMFFVSFQCSLESSNMSPFRMNSFWNTFAPKLKSRIKVT
jgi:hypothetical protein